MLNMNMDLLPRNPAHFLGSMQFVRCGIHVFFCDEWLSGWVLGTCRYFCYFICARKCSTRGLEHFFHPVGNFIIPTDEVIFFRGSGIPPTVYIYIFPCIIWWLISTCVFFSVWVDGHVPHLYDLFMCVLHQETESWSIYFCRVRFIGFPLFLESQEDLWVADMAQNTSYKL